MAEWRLVRKHPLYEVSDEGDVRRIGKSVLKPRLMNKGYYKVGLTAKSKTVECLIHRLVCSAFKGEPDKGMTVDHLDGNKINNRAKNLEWVTMDENINRAILDGRINPPPTRYGVDVGNAKLTPEQVVQIRENPAGLTGTELAKLYGVSATNISLIKRNKAWCHIK